MTFRKSLIVKEAVIEGYAALQKQGEHLINLHPRKLMVLLAALLVAGSIVAGVYHYSGQGDFVVLKQRLFGEVHLSEGTYSARTLKDLNQLSWENGLEIIATLDTMNKTLQTLEAMTDGEVPADTSTAKLKTTLADSESQLKALLKDRRALEKAASLLKADQLYTPVYQEYLRETLSRLTSVKQSLEKSDRLVQK
jgi:hypothetical protein